jgi:hypothetical protein
MMAAGPSAHAVRDLVDQAVDRLLNDSQASQLLLELARLRDENAQLKASLEVDDREISSLWAKIGESPLDVGPALLDVR